MNIRFSRTGLLVLSALCVGAVFPAYAQDGVRDRLTKITAFFKMNATAEAFRDYCDETGKIKLNLNYTANSAAVNSALVQALMKARPSLSLEQSKRNVAARETVFKREAYKEFKDNGCNTEAGRAAYAHIQKLSKPKPSQILAYLRDL